MTTSRPRFFAHRSFGLAPVALAGLLLSALPAQAQTGAGVTGNASSADTGRGAPGARNASASGSADHRMIGDLAQANMAEIATGKLALEKAESEATKKFAQRMIDDHSAALKEIQLLASSKSIKLPDEPSVAQKARATALKALSGSAFDNRYKAHAGVGDHERTVALLQKIEKTAQDAEVKALATKMLPKVREHLKSAHALQSEKSASSAGSRTEKK